MNLPTLTSPTEWAIIKEQASLLVKSGMLPATINTPEKAIAIALKGREIGFPIMASFAYIKIIQGTPAVDAMAQLAKVRQHYPRARIWFTKLTSEVVTVRTQRSADEPEQEFSFSKADAEAAGLWGKDNWRKYPRAMLRSRVVSEMCRSVYPDAILGIAYTPDELGVLENDEGEVYEVKAEESVGRNESQPAHEGGNRGAIDASPTSQATPKAETKVYEGTDAEQKRFELTFRTNQIPEEHWGRIHAALLGKPITQWRKIANDVIYGGER